MPSAEQIDDFLAAAMLGEAKPWPEAWRSPAEIELFFQRTNYQGVTALILPLAGSWPAEIRAGLREQSLRRAAWELRHFDLLQSLLGELAKRGVEGLFLKGTALAYHVYDEPSSRARADTDVLVRPIDFEKARQALAAAGFADPGPEVRGEDSLQETWRMTAAGMGHAIDLHRTAFNSHYLAKIMPVEECFRSSLPLTSLGENARMLAAPHFLLHVCIHRSMHRTAPYFSGGKAMLSPDRLIWARDIALLTGRFDDADWQAFLTLAREKKVARAMLEALEFAERAGAAAIPSNVKASLADGASADERSSYMLDAGRRSRVIANLRAGSWRQLVSQLRSLARPSDQSLRARYPGWQNAPRFLLLARRMFDFVTGNTR